MTHYNDDQQPPVHSQQASRERTGDTPRKLYGAPSFQQIASRDTRNNVNFNCDGLSSS